ncbi:hypothetical protein [Pseudomaricurvus sp. HS19]|uniref:hypothetical protein n=1 Tax=Pseudomaricurvus sp. HS19 TaxID=2692626 RepID=UPI00136AFE7E|nr:hypothetical protein [Pseudomaricurvus sp. HS19]MYM63950.1 hypothetical protein [Pseudomaricurvus sp. HS19]
MASDNQQALIEATLTRTAEQVGDITPLVIQQLYHRFPEMEASFKHHGLGKQQQLEGDMVQNALYCLMDWYADPGSIEVMLAHSVPHHHYTLKVPPHWYAGLLEVTAAVVGESIPPEAGAEQAAWEALTSQLLQVLEESSQHTDAPYSAAQIQPAQSLH